MKHLPRPIAFRFLTSALEMLHRGHRSEGAIGCIRSMTVHPDQTIARWALIAAREHEIPPRGRPRQRHAAMHGNDFLPGVS